jgi:hypothetical protein
MNCAIRTDAWSNSLQNDVLIIVQNGSADLIGKPSTVRRERIRSTFVLIVYSFALKGN